jgi:hypothetical protein
MPSSIIFLIGLLQSGGIIMIFLELLFRIIYAIYTFSIIIDIEVFHTCDISRAILSINNYIGGKNTVGV